MVNPVPPRSARALAVAAAVLAGGCDRLPEAVIVPEYEFAYSFESGLAGWTEGRADLGTGTAAVTTTTGQAAAGSASLLLTVDNAGGAAKVWITRELAVTKDQSYTVDVTLKLASVEPQGTPPWKVVAGVRANPPASSAELPIQDETAPGGAGGAVAWTEKKYSIPARADDEGRLFLTLGLWATSPGVRSYWIDDVRVVLTRS